MAIWLLSICSWSRSQMRSILIIIADLVTIATLNCKMVMANVFVIYTGNMCARECVSCHLTQLEIPIQVTHDHLVCCFQVLPSHLQVQENWFLN